MFKKDLVLCADHKCRHAKMCYYYRVDPTSMFFNKVKAVDSLNYDRKYECEFFKFYVKAES